jgi:hypothetical protein
VVKGKCSASLDDRTPIRQYFSQSLRTNSPEEPSESDTLKQEIPHFAKTVVGAASDQIVPQFPWVQYGLHLLSFLLCSAAFCTHWGWSLVLAVRVQVVLLLF